MGLPVIDKNDGTDAATDVTVPMPVEAAQTNPVPLYCKKVLVMVGATINDVAPDPVLNGI